jgi:5-oxoprolinase (ATP-hydrolysing) subunit A
MVKAGRKEGLKVAEEAYIDRTYDDTGAMTSRKFADAMIHDKEKAVKQVLSFLSEGAVISKTGKKFPTKIHTLCCHGDEGTGVEVVSAVRQALEKNGIKLKTLPEMELS